MQLLPPIQAACKTTSRLQRSVLTLATVLGLSAWAVAAPVLVEITDPQDRVLFEGYLKVTESEMAKLTKEHFLAITEPEDLCWTDLRAMQMPLGAYELTGDAKYLRLFTDILANLRASVKEGPDGYLGWYGKGIEGNADPAKPDAIVSEIQTDFRAVTVFSRFIELTDADPALKAEYAPLRAELVDLMQNHLVRKWDANFRDLGKRGAVYQWHADYKPNTALVSLPQEKVSMMIEGLLALYRVTGEDEYMHKAIKLGTWFKYTLAMEEGRYWWNRWQPAASWDVSVTDPAKWKTWVAPEPIGAWYASSVKSAMLLYHHGVVFTKEDRDRFVKTQVEACWNGDPENPEYFTVRGVVSNKPNQKFIALDLTPFDEKFYQLVFEGKEKEFYVSKAGTPWHGGVQLTDWLLDKYINVPKARGGELLFAQAGEQFLAKPENQELVKELAHEVVPPGYQTPPVPPADMAQTMPDPAPETP